MSVQADPQKLKYGANRFAAGSQELRSKGRRLEEISQNVLRGQYGWTGQGARAFEQIGEQLGREMDQATDVLQRAATVMQTFGYRMEQVNQLRDQAERLERQLWHIDTSTPEGRHEASELRHRMHDLNNRAEYEARIADQQAARGFDELAESAFLRNFADPSWWDRFVGGVKEGAGVVGSFFQGMGDAVVDTAEGIWHVVTHPIDTLEGLISSLSHPIDTWNAIKTAVIDSWEKDVVNGDADSRAKWFGYAIGQVALSLVSTKGADKAVKVVRSVAKPKTAHAAKASDLATDGANAGSTTEAAVVSDQAVSVKTPSEIARSWQGDHPYIGKDVYRDIVLKPGKILYAGHPYPSGYMTTARAIDRSGADAGNCLTVCKWRPGSRMILRCWTWPVIVKR